MNSGIYNLETGKNSNLWKSNISFASGQKVKDRDWQRVSVSFEGAGDILFLDLGSVSVVDNLLCRVLIFRCILKMWLTCFMQLRIREVKVWRQGTFDY